MHSHINRKNIKAKANRSENHLILIQILVSIIIKATYVNWKWFGSKIYKDLNKDFQLLNYLYQRIWTMAWTTGV